jgi:hypothetical protein
VLDLEHATGFLSRDRRGEQQPGKHEQGERPFLAFICFLPRRLRP